MKFDADELEYGFVLTRIPGESAWWHGHLVRCNLAYECDVLGRRTNLFFSVVKLGVGSNRLSPSYLLTLDGEGIVDTTGIQYRSDWSDRVDELAEREWVSSFFVPLLHNDPDFQRAIWFLVDHLEFETVADVKIMQRLEPIPD